MQHTKLGLQTLKEDGAEGTSLPNHYTPDEMRAAAERDHKLRLEGGQNVLNAARAAGARRYIIQSTGFYYAPGPGLAHETDPLALNASPAISANVRTYTQLENRTLGAEGLEGVALRYGFFYGARYMVPARRGRSSSGAGTAVSNCGLGIGSLVLGAR